MGQIKFAFLPIAALLAAPAAASIDGTVGTTSNGSFNVTAAVSTPPQDTVQVYNLFDLSFIFSSADSEGFGSNMQFCLVRLPNGGNVGVTVSSIAAGDTDFLIHEASTANTIQLAMTLDSDADGIAFSGSPLVEGTQQTFFAPSACDPGQGKNASLLVAPAPRFGVPFVAGSYSNTFLISVAPN